MASSLKPFKDDSLVTPQQPAAAQKQLYKSPETAWKQLKDREGNTTDVYLPPGIFPPVGWYPGDPPISPRTTTRRQQSSLCLSRRRRRCCPRTTASRPDDGLPARWRLHRRMALCAFKRPGVPGDTEDNSFNLATPERDQME